MAKLALVCSSGGHLFQMYSLQAFWGSKDRFWVSFPTEDAKCLLQEEKKYWAYFPTNRSIRNFIKNLFFAYNVLKQERPDVIFSTGAGVCVPFVLVGRLMNIRTIYLESITRRNGLSLSAWLVYPFVDKLLVQWPELALKYRKATFQGAIL